MAISYKTTPGDYCFSGVRPTLLAPPVPVRTLLPVVMLATATGVPVQPSILDLSAPPILPAIAHPV